VRADMGGSLVGEKDNHVSKAPNFVRQASACFRGIRFSAISASIQYLHVCGGIVQSGRQQHSTGV
jgi:hypothetical protein